MRDIPIAVAFTSPLRAPPRTTVMGLMKVVRVLPIAALMMVLGPLRTLLYMMLVRASMKALRLPPFRDSQLKI
jgi:hypothetical protein